MVGKAVNYGNIIYEGEDFPGNTESSILSAAVISVFFMRRSQVSSSSFQKSHFNTAFWPVKKMK
jgi:hypothetical protein